MYSGLFILSIWLCLTCPLAIHVGYHTGQIAEGFEVLFELRFFLRAHLPGIAREFVLV